MTLLYLCTVEIVKCHLMGNRNRFVTKFMIQIWFIKWHLSARPNTESIQ